MEDFRDKKENKSLKILLARLQLRKMRMENQKTGSAPVPSTPIDERENQLFEAIRKQYQQKITEEAMVSPSEAEALFNSTITEPFGKKFVVEIFTREPLVYGLPYKYFVANAFLCLAAFVCTNNSIVVLLIAAFIHVTGLFYYSRIKDRAAKKKSDSILQQGIKL